MKYELSEEKNEAGLYRIRALRDIPRHGVKAGDLGGFVESERNLSQEGDAWIGGKAVVCDNAKVYGNAEVHGEAVVCGNAEVHGNAEVCGNAWISGNTWVYGKAWVYGDARISGNAKVGSDSVRDGTVEDGGGEGMSKANQQRDENNPPI
ncbi:MAG: hypothetical protein LBS45_00100 [Synergistaceae bacterium]|jgi:UDP-3-O-[3-hydroxymyristoyl] glucosamine N-acyltransferase|nr:hypothetical protein [Synergistaceae bacterium]